MAGRKPTKICSLVLSVVSCCLLAACAGSGGVSPLSSVASSGGQQGGFDSPIHALSRKKSSNPIQHVIIIIQENQSFDHLFAGAGISGANVATTGKIHTGAKVPLTQQELGAAVNTGHYSTDFLTDYDDGNMDGFDLNTFSPRSNLATYTYINPSEIQPYIQMANQYVLADNYFTSHIDASFVGHQYLIAAYANHAVNLPSGNWGCDNPPSAGVFVPTLNANRSVGGVESPCFTYTTLADELDSAGLTWHFYAPMIPNSGSIWSAYQAINQIYNGPDWTKDVISPETQILTDIPNGTLENVTWVVPNNNNSDHPGSNSMTGPDWVGSIVNAVGESQYWDNTIIFITWDEWGGEYDHVPPPYMDYDGDGFRVPMLCISPYAYAGQVNHTQLEAASIPRYVENLFGLSTLAAADKRAKAADSGCTNPNQTSARSFTPISIPSSYNPNYFLHRQKRSNQPPDDS